MGSKWRHEKGNEYVIVGYCIFEKSWRPAYLYKGAAAGVSLAIARDCEEFLDGRFERIK